MSAGRARDRVIGLTELDLDRPHVAGNSLGGAVALELAAAGAVASATAFSPAGFCTARELRRALTVLGLHRTATRLPTPVLRSVFASPALRALALGMILARPERMAVEAALAGAPARPRLPGGRPGRPRYAFAGSPDRLSEPPRAAPSDVLVIHHGRSRSGRGLASVHPPTAERTPLEAVPMGASVVRKRGLGRRCPAGNKPTLGPPQLSTAVFHRAPPFHVKQRPEMHADLWMTPCTRDLNFLWTTRWTTPRDAVVADPEIDERRCPPFDQAGKSG